MSRRIAPALQEAMEIAYLSPEVRREVKALLRVARAANKAWYAAEKGTPAILRLGDALAALDRAGSAEGGGE